MNTRPNTEAGGSNFSEPILGRDARQDLARTHARTHDTHAIVDRLRRRHFTIGTDELKMRDSFRFEAAARSVAFGRAERREGGRAAAAPNGGECVAARRLAGATRSYFSGRQVGANPFKRGRRERGTEGEREGRKMRVARPPNDRHIRRANFKIARS